MPLTPDQLLIEDINRILDTVNREKILKAMMRIISRDGAYISTNSSDVIRLYNNNELVPGVSYAMMDFNTVHKYIGTQDIYQSTTIEPIVVTAESTNRLSPIATSLLHRKDILYFDITGSQFTETTGITSVPFKGVIYRRVDTEKNIDMPLDFRYAGMRRHYTSLGYWLGGIEAVMPTASTFSIGTSNRYKESVYSTIGLLPISTLIQDNTLRATAGGVLTSLLLVRGGWNDIEGLGLFTTTPTFTIPAQNGGVAATGHCTLAATGGLKGGTITAGGTLYNDTVQATVVGTGTGAKIKLIFTEGVLTGYKVINRGEGYDNTTTISIPASPGGGINATMDAVIGYLVESVDLDTGGTLYSAEIAPVITGDGNGLVISALENPYGYVNTTVFPSFNDGTSIIRDIVMQRFSNSMMNMVAFKASYQTNAFNFSDIRAIRNGWHSTTTIGNVTGITESLIDTIAVIPNIATIKNEQVMVNCTSAWGAMRSCIILNPVYGLRSVSDLGNMVTEYPHGIANTFRIHGANFAGQAHHLIFKRGFYNTNSTSFSGRSDYLTALKTLNGVQFQGKSSASSVGHSLTLDYTVSDNATKTLVIPQGNAGHIGISGSTFILPAEISGLTTFDASKFSEQHGNATDYQSWLYCQYDCKTGNATETISTITKDATILTPPIADPIIRFRNALAATTINFDVLGNILLGAAWANLALTFGQHAEFRWMGTKWCLTSTSGTLT